MAVIQKIRNKYGKLAGGIIALALVGFILMDAASGRFGDLFGRNTSVAKVDGDKIEVREYSLRVKEIETLYPLYSRTKTMDDATRAQMSEETMKQMIYEILAKKQCEKLGIGSTKEEEKEMIYGANADPMIQQFQIQGTNIFVSQETGMFDPSIIKEFEKQISKIDPSGKVQEQWDYVKAYVIRNHAINKFGVLFAKGTYIPKFLALQAMNLQNATANISFVKIPVSSITDNEVKVSDEDIKSYMQKHAAMFTSDDNTRSMDFVSFDVKPSKEDTARPVNALLEIKNDFAATKDNENFVNNKSEDKFEKSWVNKRTLISSSSDSILSLALNGVYGPYYENNNYKLTKLIEKKDMPDSVKCRHILIRTKSQGKDVLPDSIAKQRMDSIVTAIKNGADFKALALKYSDDPGSSKTGGEYTFSVPQRSNLSKEFGDFIFDGKTGEKKTVHVDNDNYTGYHYIEILEQKNMQPAYQFATISKSLYPDQNTVNAAYAKASAFAGKNATAQAFDDGIKKDGLSKRIGENVKIYDFTIQGLGPAREIVRWMYEAKPGDVSPVFTLDNRFIVAKLSSIQEKGLAPVTTENRPQLDAIVKAEKKKELIISKYKNVTSLESLAQSSNQQVQHVDSVSLGGSFAPNLGFAPKVIGYAFDPSFAPNTISPAIQEQEGVYFIMVTNRWNKTIDPQAAESAVRQQMMMMQMQQQRNAGGQGVQETLINSASVKYNASNL
jgi:peptidyl-prolyl cis-trans isomerase D